MLLFINSSRALGIKVCVIWPTLSNIVECKVKDSILCPSINYVLGAWLRMHPYESRGIVSPTLVLPIFVFIILWGSERYHPYFSRVCAASRRTHAPHALLPLKALVNQGMGARENVSWRRRSCRRANIFPRVRPQLYLPCICTCHSKGRVFL